MTELVKGIWANHDQKWDLQLSEARVRESRLAAIFANAKFHTVELKSERYLWERSGNLCVEYRQRGAPSGIATTEADVWVHELIDYRNNSSLGYFLVPMPRMKELARRAIKDGRVRHGVGDNGQFDAALVPISWLTAPG